ncbi:MAG: prolyl oligopeptidase family serine peptidase [Planctomycetaceae bacterium]|nr:prolyl oligopeptidase family serine peptidase [Planctomycetaceae bacterium]
MAVRVSCPCGRTLNLADILRGKKVRCPECSAAITVPMSESNASPTRGASHSQQSPDAPRPARHLNEESQQPPSRTKPPDAKPKASSQTKKPANRGDKRRPALNPNVYGNSDDVEWLDEADSASWNELPYEAATMPGRSTQSSNTGRHRGATARSSDKSVMPRVIKMLLIAGAVSIVPIVIGFVVLKSVGGGSSGAGIPDVASFKVKQEIFPQRPMFQPSFPSGVQLARARLTGRGPGEQTQMNIYLPAGEHAARSLGCVLVAPAGTNLLVGNSLDGDDYHDETLPYAEAGFMTIQYSLDGPVSELETATDGEFSAAYKLFKAAGAGLLNTRCAIEFVKARFPEVDPARIYTAGHSSAGTVSLLAAEYHSDVAACIAYAPCSDVEERHAGMSDAFGVNFLFPGIAEFDRQFSPMAQVHRLKCPLFVFHARDDSVLEVGISQRFVEQARAHNQQVEYIEVESGDHYDSMIQDGIPHAVQWLKKIDSARAVEMKSKPFATLDSQ